MQQAIKREELFRLFIDRISDGFLIVDKDFNYLYVNRRIGELVHRDPTSLVGKNIWKEFPDAVNSFTYRAFQTALKEQRFISNVDYYAPLDLWQENYIYPSPDGLSVFIRDVSEQKRLQKQLREQQINQQFEIMITGLEAQEKERTVIGRELHDNVNQMLVATKLMLALHKDRPNELTEAVVERCIGNLERAIEENRRISHELVTPDLREEKLQNQLQWLVQSMLHPNGINTHIKTHHFDENKLDEKRKLAIYRIAQEQCTNIIKHSKANKVIISLSILKDQFVMKITDNGKGTDKQKTTQGIGLKNIEGRVAFYEGSLHVRTTRNKGFVLQIMIPLFRADRVYENNKAKARKK